MIDLGDRMIGNTDPDSGGLHPAAPRAPSTGCCRSAARTPRSCSTTATSWRPSGVSDPQDDLVSKLVTWEDDDGRRLTEQEFDTMFLLLVVAGNETTRQSIAHGHAGADGASRGDAAAARPTRR